MTPIEQNDDCVEHNPLSKPRRVTRTEKEVKVNNKGESEPSPGFREHKPGANLSELAWNRLVEAFQTHFFEPDMEAMKTLLASIAAHRLTGQPVWPMLIAPPGSLKTEFLHALSEQPDVHNIDSVTPRTFLSGQFGNKAGDTSSLLHRIGDSGILLISDFSTVTSKHNEERGQIFADLRRIFDGRLEKHFGTREGKVEWTGRITTCVAATPQVDRVTSFEGALGDRFIRIRMHRADVRAALFAMRQDPLVVRAATIGAIGSVFDVMPSFQPEASDPMLQRIAMVADFVAIGRTHVNRDMFKDISDSSAAENAESATRLSQQFYQLARGLALLGGRDTVNEADFRTMARVAFDTLPPRRANIVRQLLRGEAINKHNSTTCYDYGDLEHLGLVNCDNGFTPHGKELLSALHV